MAKRAKGEEAKREPAAQVRVVTDNRKARHDFHIIEVFQAGIALTGTEVKSARQGKVNLKDSFARIDGGQLWLHNCHISPYEHGNRFNHDPLRRRRLLMHRREIARLKAKMQEKGLTLVPLKMYFKRNWVKLDIALARGKKLYDKREAITRRETKRQLERLVKS